LVALTVLFSAVVSLSGQNASVNANTSKTEKYRLVWFEDPTTTATFVWNQLEGDPATLHYGLKNEGRNKSKYAERKEVDRVVEYDGMRNCMVTLESLKPDSWYFMCLGDGAGVSRLFLLSNSSQAAKAFHFYLRRRLAKL
jgi:hypothetical protein